MTPLVIMYYALLIVGVALFVVGIASFFSARKLAATGGKTMLWQVFNTVITLAGILMVALWWGVHNFSIAY